MCHGQVQRPPGWHGRLEACSCGLILLQLGELSHIVTSFWYATALYGIGYTVQVTELKTAHDAVDYAIYMSTQWCHDEQFFKLASEWSCNKTTWFCLRKFVSRSLATVDLLCFFSGYCLLCLHCKLDALKSLKATVL